MTRVDYHLQMILGVGVWEETQVAPETRLSFDFVNHSNKLSLTSGIFTLQPFSHRRVNVWPQL